MPVKKIIEMNANKNVHISNKKIQTEKSFFKSVSNSL